LEAMQKQNKLWLVWEIGKNIENILSATSQIS